MTVDPFKITYRKIKLRLVVENIMKIARKSEDCKLSTKDISKNLSRVNCLNYFRHFALKINLINYLETTFS